MQQHAAATLAKLYDATNDILSFTTTTSATIPRNPCPFDDNVTVIFITKIFTPTVNIKVKMFERERERERERECWTKAFSLSNSVWT